MAVLIATDFKHRKGQPTKNVKRFTLCGLAFVPQCFSHFQSFRCVYIRVNLIKTVFK